MPSPTLYERGDKLVELAKINWIVWAGGRGYGNLCFRPTDLAGIIWSLLHLREK